MRTDLITSLLLISDLRPDSCYEAVSSHLTPLWPSNIWWLRHSVSLQTSYCWGLLRGAWPTSHPHCSHHWEASPQPPELPWTSQILVSQSDESPAFSVIDPQCLLGCVYTQAGMTGETTSHRRIVAECHNKRQGVITHLSVLPPLRSPNYLYQWNQNMDRRNVNFCSIQKKRCSMLPNWEFIDFTSRLTVIKYESVRREVQPWESPAWCLTNSQKSQCLTLVSPCLLSAGCIYHSLRANNNERAVWQVFSKVETSCKPSLI